jgi:tRNA(adenine34) deaminase
MAKPNNAMQYQMGSDEYWMAKALKEAQKAQLKQEVPVGALVVKEGQVLARGHNLKELLPSPLGHAETIAIHRAAKKQGAWRLTGATLYVTLEPCLMCAGALWQARISRVVFGAFDPKAGALASLYAVGSDQRLNHRFEVIGGVLQADCQQILKDFFKQMRAKK